MTSRRQFLRALGGAGVAIAGSGGARVCAQPAPSLRAIELREDLFQVTGAGANVVVLAKPDGLLLVDSGAPAHGAALQRLLSERFGAPVRVLLNTHWHLPHTGGNEAVVEDDTTIVAHEHTRLWMSTKFYVEWEDKRYLPRPARALPNKTFFSHEPQPIEIDFFGERVLYEHLPEAHTDGDLYVRFPQRNVIVAGGALTVDTYPTLDYITGGWVGGLMDATQKLIGLSDGETLSVPEAGPAQRRADLEVQHEMLAAVRQGVESMAIKGQGIDEMIAARLTKDFEARYGNDTAAFIHNVYQGMWWNRMRAI
jgi:glyoxylase-like metal-dependent hydrolase (beta-lactamase superfamily II)